jgi:peroxiredoxin
MLHTRLAMAVMPSNICNFGWKAPDFALAGVDARTHSLADVRGRNGTVIAFICNHCPYVRAIISRLVAEATALREIAVGTIAIMPNDTQAYPEDSFEKMKAFAAQHGFTFPYVIDATQEVAKSYGALCTPDFFGFNAQDELQYRGRLDASRTSLVPNARRDLFEAMRQVAQTGRGPQEQLPSMGCSIKWQE